MPDAAIGTEQMGKFVLVVDAENVARPKQVTLGPVVDGLRVITEGLTPDDNVIINGLMRARPGVKVTPQQSSTASASTAGPKSAPIEGGDRAMRLSHFFIDRPIFAAVVSIVFVIIGAVSLERLPVAQYPEIAPPVVRVSGQYPGASADVVAATVVAPLEQQINGVENMIYMTSNSTGDGRFQIDVTLELGTNLDIAQVQVQNRVATAQPRIPADVRNIGVTTAKSSPDLMMVVHLYSPDKSRDPLFISNYANVEVTDMLNRIYGVGAITVFGARDYSMRSGSTRIGCMRLGLPPGDVVTALQGQNVQVASGVLNQPPVAQPRAFQIAVRTLGRLVDPKEFADIVVKQSSDRGRSPQGRGRIELAAVDYSTNSYRDLDPAVALAILPTAGVERAGDSREDQVDHGRALEEISRRPRSTRSSTTRPSSSNSPSTPSPRPLPRRSSWSSWWSSCSCRPGAPPSFRSWRYLCR